MPPASPSDPAPPSGAAAPPWPQPPSGPPGDSSDADSRSAGRTDTPTGRLFAGRPADRRDNSSGGPADALADKRSDVPADRPPGVGGDSRAAGQAEAPADSPFPGQAGAPADGSSAGQADASVRSSSNPSNPSTSPNSSTPSAGTPADAPYTPPANLIDAPSDTPSDQPPVQALNTPTPVGYVGSGPPTYDAEPTALPPADPDDLDDLVADTVLDGASYGMCTLRAVSVRGDSARFRGEPRRDSLLTARFGVGDGALVLVAMATGARATPGAHRAAAEVCQWIGRAVGRSHVRLAEDIRAARRGDLKSGLHRLTDRSLGKLRASAAEQGIAPEEYTAGLRCLLLPADPECRTRVFFGVGAGGLFRLRDGEWQDIEPHVADTTGEAVVGFGSLPHETPEGDRLTMDLGITTPPSPYEPAPEPPPRDPFRFRASVARPGDTLLLCTSGLAEPLRGEPRLVEHLTSRWSGGDPPGLAEFLADTLVRVKGYADDRTAAAVWEA